MCYSQEPLGTPGEQIYRIRPLAVPPADASTIDVVLTHAAAQLFLERSQSYTRDSQFDGATASEIATICRQLDGVRWLSNLQRPGYRPSAFAAYSMVCPTGSGF